MELLLLGGSRFLGRHLIEAALGRGHRVTAFNRRWTTPDLYPEIEKLRGDRDSGLGALAGRRWDAAIDTSGYVPRVVRASAAALAAGHYTLVSTLSVYPDTRTPVLDEHAPVGTPADERAEEITGATYGPSKALCERAVEAALPGRTLVIRPGPIVSPNDPTDRFTYWPGRVARGGAVLAPGRPERAIQFIDARDLAGWIVQLVEAGRTGVYNADEPARTLTMGQFPATCKAVGGGEACFARADDRFLLDAWGGAWLEPPL